MSEYIISDEQLGLIRDFATVCVEGEKLPRIVRCRDCKHRAGANVQAVVSDLCMWLDIIVKPDGFCAYGERS